MLARATCTRATVGRSSGGAPLGTRSKTPDAMGAAPSRRRASRDASGRVAFSSVARDDVVSATDDAFVASPETPVIRTSKDLASWIAKRDGSATLVRCEGALTPDVASSAEALGVDVQSIVKSLVFFADGEFVVVVTNGLTKVDVKKIAKKMGVANRRVRLATSQETVEACGFVPGTVPPFGHVRALRTFVDASVPTEVKNGPVFGGGGDPDAEVRVESVDELLRLTEGELLDVKKRERGEALPEVISAYDERRDEKTQHATVNETSETKRLRNRNREPVPAWRDAKARSVAEPQIVRAFAEVVRVRRVARFLVFATLRPLAAPTAEAPDAFDEAQRAEAWRFLAAESEGDADAESARVAPAAATVGSPVPFPENAEFQLIVGRSLVERVGEDAAERVFREVKTGGVVEVVARTQKNPRPRTVDLVARSVRVVEGREAISLLASFDAEEARELRSETHEKTKPFSKDERQNSHPASKYAPREAKEEEWGVGPCGAVADMASFGFGGSGATHAKSPVFDADDAATVSAKLERLRTGNREGKTEQFPALPRDATHWVASVAAIDYMRAATLGPSPNEKDAGERALSSEKRFDVVGIDAEWRPQSGSPVALLQIATRHEVFLVDTLTLCVRDADDADDADCAGKEETDAFAEALNRFLDDLFARRDVVKLGFGLEHDLKRLRRSFPESLSCVAEPALLCRRDGFVDVRTLCLLAFPEKRKLKKTSLAVIVASVLGAYVDKTEQCSDWARRPLSLSQIEYAAADAHVLTVLFDRCAHQAFEQVAEALSDPEAPLARPPDAKDEDAGDAKKKRTKSARGAAPRKPRPPPGPPMSELDVVRAVGTAFDGRKGVVDALSGFPEVPSDHGGRGGGGLEMLEGNFALVFVNVYSPEDGRRRRYANEFWVSGSPGGGGGSRAVRMSWFGGGGEAGTARGVAKALAETTALRDVDAFDAATREENGASPTTEKKKKKTLLLFLRKQKGPYVCCGRLRAVAVSGGDDGGGTGARVEFELVDTEALRASGKLEALVGDNLREPRAEDFFP
jgi:prolyl-tRNA editing enzyme YbaK/EbsC (Cys-tRNA(Pro) deacylase)